MVTRLRLGPGVENATGQGGPGDRLLSGAQPLAAVAFHGWPTDRRGYLPCFSAILIRRLGVRGSARPVLSGPATHLIKEEGEGFPRACLRYPVLARGIRDSAAGDIAAAFILAAGGALAEHWAADGRAFFFFFGAFLSGTPGVAGLIMMGDPFGTCRAAWCQSTGWVAPDQAAS